MAICACGKRKKIVGSNISSGRAKSCGCLILETVRKPNKKYSIPTTGYYHGLYSSYKGMMDRCYNPKVRCYKSYGGRGVKVCKMWRKSYEYFLRWALVNGWQPGLELDKDKLGTGKLYSPANCCWLTPSDNSRYKRKGGALIFEYYGINLTLGQIGKLNGISNSKMYGRVVKGHSIYDAVKMGNIRHYGNCIFTKNYLKLNPTKMYVLLSNSTTGLPIIVSMNSQNYLDLCMAGYNQIATGYRKVLEPLEEEMMESFVQELEMNTD